MSRIFTEWKCDNCASEFHQYVSFGHPDEDFDYKWKCGKCGHINTLHVEAMPMFGYALKNFKLTFGEKEYK